MPTSLLGRKSAQTGPSECFLIERVVTAIFMYIHLMETYRETLQSLQELNGALCSEGDDARVRYLSVEPDFNFVDEWIVIVTWELPPPNGESWPLKVLDNYEERTRNAVGRARTTLCLFRTPDEIAEPAHQRGEQLQAA